MRFWSNFSIEFLDKLTLRSTKYIQFQIYMGDELMDFDYT